MNSPNQTVCLISSDMNVADEIRWLLKTRCRILYIDLIDRAFHIIRSNRIDCVLVYVDGRNGELLVGLQTLKRQFKVIPVIVVCQENRNLEIARLCGVAQVECIVAMPDMAKLKEMLPHLIYRSKYKSVHDFAQTSLKCSNLVQRALRLVNQEYLSLSGVDEVARRLGVSAGSLSTVFSRESSIGLKQLIVSLKLQHAINLMRNEGLTIQEIASLVGFTNQVRFAEAFKKKYSMSPNVYRTRFLPNDGKNVKLKVSSKRTKRPLLKKRVSTDISRNSIYSFEYGLLRKA